MRTVLLIVLSGCSFFTMDGPRPPPGPTACNRDATPVVADAIVGVAAALAAGYAGVEHAPQANVVTPFAIAGVFSVSSAYGAVQLRRCRAEHEKRPAWSLAEMPAVM